MTDTLRSVRERSDRGGETVPKDYYERYWSDENYLFPERGLDENVRRLFDRHVDKDDACIDVGCGRGRSGVWLREHAASYVGVDVSENAVEHARQLGLNALAIEDAAKLPFEDDSFDMAACIEVLEHLLEPHSVAREILRVLRPGGRLIATVPNLAQWRRRVDIALLGRWNPYGDPLSVEKPWRDPHIRFFTTSSPRRMLVEAGFFPLEIGGHAGSGLAEVPYLWRLARRETAGPINRRLVEAAPSLFATRIHAVARKPVGAAAASS